MLNLVLLGQATDTDVVLFSFSLLLVLAVLTAYFFISFFRVKRKVDVSPYTGMPLRFASEIPYASREKITNFLKIIIDYNNQLIDFERASFCRDTGRIFPNTVTWTGAIKLDWTFIIKRYRGNYVSWGSLSPHLQKEIRSAHSSLDGFQTHISSKNPSPRSIEEDYAMTRPGPLYVDPETKVLIGWVIVPGTAFEILVVQKPLKVSFISFEQKKKEKKEHGK